MYLKEVTERIPICKKGLKWTILISSIHVVKKLLNTRYISWNLIDKTFKEFYHAYFKEQQIRKLIQQCVIKYSKYMPSNIINVYSCVAILFIHFSITFIITL